MRFLKSAVLTVAAGAGVVMAQTAVDPNTLPECASTCLANMQAKFGDFSCASADDFNCLCRAPAWRDGIASCASGTCGGEQTDGYQQVTAYANEKCAIVTGTSSSTPSTSAAQSAPPETTSAPVESTTAETTSAPPSTSTTDAVTTTSTSSTPTTLLTSTKPPANGTSSLDASSETRTSAADATSASSASSDNTDSDGDSSGSGITTGAKIGIAVGAGAAGVILLALLIALCCRRRDRKAASLDEKNIQISSPMPGSGRSYASDDGSPKAPVAAAPVARSKGAGKSQLELTSTRYENMVPRTQPSLTDVRN